MEQRERDWAAAMRAAQRGDRAAYARLLGEIAVALRGRLRVRLGRLGLSPDEAEDVVQEVLVTLHRRRDSWDPARPFLPWLNAIAARRLVDAARRLGRLRRRRADGAIEDWADLLPAPAPDDAAPGEPERLVAALSGREREVVAALGLDGASVAAAAARLTISEGAVRVAFHRGLARLRRWAESGR